MENSYTNMVELIKDYNSANVGNYLNQSITLGSTTLICDIYRVADNSNLTSSVFTGCTAVDANTQIIIGKNLSVASGVTLRPPYRCKGIFVGCEGTFTNSGTISMTARGASGTGQDIPLFKTYKINATGGSGGASSSSDSDSTSAAVVTNGKAGSSPASGVLSCGGGGSGGAVAAYSYSTSGAGGSGTSFSGGAGGGGAGRAGQNSTGKVGATGSAGSSTGGAGGKSATLQYSSLSPSLGGAGNPKGSSYYTSGTPDSNGDGTGGLLVIIAKHLVSSGNLYSEGSQGPGGTSFTNGAGGGASGGGCIVLLSKDSNVTGTTSVAGGSQSSMSGTNVAKGGKGGDGVLADINESNLVLSDGEDLSLGITESQYLSQIPIQNGRLLGLSDKNGLYYEYDGTRYKAGDVSSLGDLDNVNISSVADKQVLTYDSTTSKWKNANATGASALDELNDVDVTTPSNDDVLKYNSTSGKWENGQGGGGGASALNDLTDVTITSATSGQSLKYDGSKWVNDTVSGGHTVKNSSDTALTQRPTLKFASPITATDDSTNQQTVIDLNTTAQVDFSQFSPPSQMSPGISNLVNLDDTNITSAVDGQALVYNSSTSKWVNSYRDYHEYSTTEKVVGKWTDGSTIYEKVITGTMPTCSTDGTEVHSFISLGVNVSKVINIAGYVSGQSGTASYPMPILYIGSNKYYRFTVTLNNNTSDPNKLRIGNSATAFNGISFYAVIQYTKA